MKFPTQTHFPSVSQNDINVRREKSYGICTEKKPMLRDAFGRLVFTEMREVKISEAWAECVDLQEKRKLFFFLC